MKKTIKQHFLIHATIGYDLKKMMVKNSNSILPYHCSRHFIFHKQKNKTEYRQVPIEKHLLFL